MSKNRGPKWPVILGKAGQLFQESVASCFRNTQLSRKLISIAN